ncbi:hypothetical protein [Marivita sp.]|uniref:hypothetical protein n=1 Tax=Marivita sp. TaxID=2003365 RepID=UPI003F6F11FB
MTDIRFDRLIDLPLRDAWRHEASDFTPWLAGNIVHLSDAIGIPLELTGTEVAVESFSADILARNPMDDSVVLIENQLETTDHTHLGQIMTYLAGLEAQTVIWIAPQFREPHLSAIRWLNQHTADGFSFFAVKARVVRIGDSPFAPIFEVVEKPNDWNRALRPVAERGSLQANRQQFFELLNRKLEKLPLEKVGQYLIRYLEPDSEYNPLFVSVHATRNRCGCDIRSVNDAVGQDLSDEITLHAPWLVDRFGDLRARQDGGAVSVSKSFSLTDHETWNDATDWLSKQIIARLEEPKT